MNQNRIPPAILVGFSAFDNIEHFWGHYGDDAASDAFRGDWQFRRLNGVLVRCCDAKQAAAICGKSLRTWRTWDAAGWIPRPVRIGRSTLWRADELRDWVAAGCPRREEWEARTC